MEIVAPKDLEIDNSVLYVWLSSYKYHHNYECFNISFNLFGEYCVGKNNLI
jgi:hypothetical protein